VRRLSFAAVLVVAAVTPGQASGWTPPPCQHAHCESAGTVRWIRGLPGTWVARGGLTGTAPGSGQAFAALSGQVAVVGAGLSVYAFAADTGRPLWTRELTGFPAGSAIDAVRAWPGVVTVGVTLPAAAESSPRAKAARQAGGLRDEVVLRGSTGQRLGVHPAAMFGGAVAAGHGAVVIMGMRSVTSYSNRTGRVLWSRPTGLLPQAWQEDGHRLYVTVAAGGYLGTAPVTALRRIDLRTGAQRLIRPLGRDFEGSLSLAFDGVVLFSTARGVAAYSGATGQVLWRHDRALPDTVDAAAQRIYLISGSQLIGVDPGTGVVMAHVPGAGHAATAGLYAVREGAVLGVDHGGGGKAWGYDVASQRVVWTSRPLPWPHYFVDLSGIGGSAPPDVGAVLLAACGQLGQPLPANAGQRCARPELVVLNR
jgi:outer membrane protein assembly factor BamB